MERNDYTLREFFDTGMLTIKAVAEEAELSSNMMRQYVCEVKNPSAERLKVIEKAIHRIGKRLKTVKLT
jgi:hypothetical protein